MFGLPVHVLTGEMLMGLLRRVEAGETPDDVYLEMYVNSEQMTMGDMEEGE